MYVPRGRWTDVLLVMQYCEKYSVVTRRVPFDVQLLPTGEKDCFVMFKLVLLYNTIMRSDASLTDWHMVLINLHVL